MAFYRTGGGGSATETVLWTNASPSSSFSNKTVNLSGSLSDYDYIKVIWKYNYSSDTRASVIMPMTDFVNSIIGSGHNTLSMSVSSGSSSSSYGMSRVLYGSDTTVTFSNVGSTNYCIPLEVIGIKEA